MESLVLFCVRLPARLLPLPVTFTTTTIFMRRLVCQLFPPARDRGPGFMAGHNPVPLWSLDAHCDALTLTLQMRNRVHLAYIATSALNAMHQQIW